MGFKSDAIKDFFYSTHGEHPFRWITAILPGQIPRSQQNWTEYPERPGWRGNETVSRQSPLPEAGDMLDTSPGAREILFKLSGAVAADKLAG